MSKQSIIIIFSLVSLLTSMNTLGATSTSNWTLDVAQTITIASASPTLETIEAIDGFAYQDTVWTITTNNAFTIAFTGTGKWDDGETVAFPFYSKQDVDANGSLIDSNYDHLWTQWRIVASGYSSITGTATWEAGNNGTSMDLVSTTSSGRPALGTIMPDDDLGTAVVTLTGRAQRDIGDQSGNYTATVVAVVTADEKL